MKNVKFCPVCGVKKLMHQFQINVEPSDSYNNGVALTPPMGWSSWNLFRNKINENLIKEIADAMAQSGLSEAGYKYVNIDDCWQSSSRDSDGRLQPDKINFPSGMKALSAYVNEKGLKLGIYSSNGTLTCEDYPASLGHERTDAETFAEWGIEYFKYDFCHNKPIPFAAPLIAKISIGDESGDIVTRYACEAEFTGNARTVKYGKIDGGFYIKGLSSYSGTAEFSAITVPEEKDYVLTLTIKKEGLFDKFLVVLINGEDEYTLTVPGTKSPTPEGRIQTVVKLKKGENTIKLYNPIGSIADSSARQYTNMGRELKRAVRKYALETGTEEKPIVFSICEWGVNRPWKWGRQAGNLWRTTPDIFPTWVSIVGIYEITLKLGKYACPGGWNDPDMLEVGNGKLTFEENKSHFSLWCMMSAPLILGNDIRKYVKGDGSVATEDKTWQILTNKHLIGIDQDELGIPCAKINRSRLVDVLVKPLANGKAALCVFNKDSKPAEITVALNDVANAARVNLPSKAEYSVFNCWTEETRTACAVTSNLPAHGVEVYIIE